VYILKSLKTEEWYTGCTSDLRKRIAQHNTGASTYTKDRGPYELIYYEASLNKADAFARERYLKSGMGKRYVKNRLKHQLEDSGDSPR
jgi:putative endonuclease